MFHFYRITEYSQNYVDRVRLNHFAEGNNNKNNIEKEYPWKQKSASNLDLSIVRKTLNSNHLKNQIRASKSLDNTNNNNDISEVYWDFKEYQNDDDLRSIGYSKIQKKKQH